MPAGTGLESATDSVAVGSLSEAPAAAPGATPSPPKPEQMAPRRVERLYLPEKYKVWLGSGVHVGLCTAWSDPDVILKLHPELKKHCAIIGTLYSREGVNIMLRNLALNPQITHVLVWGQQPMSRTPIGKSGTEVLNVLWKKGVAADGTVDGFKIHPNMDPAIINKVVQNVTIVDISGVDVKKLAEVVKEVAPKEQYMTPVDFPIYEREAADKLPSEETGFLVRGPTIADVWVKIIDRIMRYGTDKMSEYGWPMRELAITWIADTEESANDPYIPDYWPQSLRELIGVQTKDHIRKYISGVFMSRILPPGSTYAYGHRLRAYPIEEGKAVDQVRYIINKFKEFKTTRRGVATFWNPALDHGKDNPPCISFMQAINNEDRLHLFVIVRSEDMMKAALPNAYGLRAIQEEIAKELGLKPGRLSVTTISSHVYQDDFDDAKMLLKCAIWDRPVDLVFRPERDADPRGNFIITIAKDGRIVADFVAPNGEPMMTIDGRSAKEVFKKIARLDLLSKSDHMFDVGAELQKAEIARDLGITYHQDRTLDISRFKGDVRDGESGS